MKICTVLLSAAFAVSLFAAEGGVIRTLENRDLKVSSIQALPDGTLEYTLADGKVKTKIPRGRYLYAWIPMPAELSRADEFLKNGSFAQAAAAYKSAYDKDKLLGWDLYCIAGEAEALAGLGEKEEAVKRLDPLKNYKLQNLRLVPHLNRVRRLNARLSIELGKYEDAMPLLNEMSSGSDDSNAAFAFLQKGNILRKKGSLKEASLMYLQAVLLFDRTPERPEALYSLASVLKELKDPNAEKFAGILKKEYPESPYVRLLSGTAGGTK